MAAGPVSRILSAGLLQQDGHSSGPRITARLKRPTRRFDAPSQHVSRRCRKLLANASSLPQRRDFLPIWSCSVWGLPGPPHYCDGGALLPHLFTLTPPFWSAFVAALHGRGRPRLHAAKSHKNVGAVYFLWHFPSDGLESALPDVIRHTALRSSDFPLPASEDTRSDRPVRLPTGSLYMLCNTRHRFQRFISMLQFTKWIIVRLYNRKSAIIASE